MITGENSTLQKVTNLTESVILLDKTTESTHKTTAKTLQRGAKVKLMYYSLSENHPYLVEMDPPVHIREIAREVMSDIRRRHKAHGVTLADLKAQIRERRIYAGVTA